MTYYPTPDTFQQAFIYAGGMNNGISFDQGSAGNAINNNGQVVGTTNEFYLNRIAARARVHIQLQRQYRG